MSVTSETEPSAAERAYAVTKDRIIRGELVGGASLSETTVCQELGLSRTPVHEAFLRLATEELLTLESRKGAVVKPLSPSEADDVVEMRGAVEAAAATRAIEALASGDPARTELIAVLRGLLARQEESVASGDTDAFVVADDSFHTVIVTASRNPIAVQFWRLLGDRAQRLRHQLMRVQPEHLETSLRDHRELADAVERGDAGAYRSILVRHIGVLKGIL